MPKKAILAVGIVLLLVFFTFNLFSREKRSRIRSTIVLPTGMSNLIICENGDRMDVNKPGVMDGGSIIEDQFGNLLRSTSETGSTFGWMYYVKQMFGLTIGC